MKKITDNIGELDRLDVAILNLLAKDGRMSISEIARQVGASKSPCQVRVKRLQEQGYILGFRAVLNPHKLGREHVAFTEVKLSDTREPALQAFNAAVGRIPEIEQCHMIAGSYDYLLKIRSANIHAYRKFLGEEISALPYVSNTSTFVAMESVKDYSF